jgi:DNA-binding response OmpR family regulator
VDVEGGNVYVEGERLDPPLPKYQFRLLRLLYENRDKVCTTDTIVKNVWPKESYYDVDDQRIHALVSRLRSRVEPGGRPWQYIRTVRGRGLILRCETED